MAAIIKKWEVIYWVSVLSEQIKLQLVGNANITYILEPINPIPLNFEITYIFHSITNSTFQIKIGRENFLSVKNMREFLKAIYYKDKKVVIGKDFTFNPMVDIFREKDQKIIDLLLEIYDFETTRYLGKQGTFNFVSEDENINIPEMQLKKFFRIMKSAGFTAIINGTMYTNVILQDENLPLDFYMLQDKDFFTLKIKASPLKLTENSGYFFYNGKIYVPDATQLKTYDIFNRFFEENKTDTMQFNIEEAETIAAFIIPALKRISSNLYMNEKLSDTFYEVPLGMKIFLDKQGDNIELELVFIYGDIKINSISNNTSTIIGKYIIRDISEEQKP